MKASNKDVDVLIEKYATLFGDISSGPENVLGTARLLHELRYDLERLVQNHFDLPGETQGAAPRSDSMERHIERMWDWLTRRPGDLPERSTLLPVNHPYVVPGARYMDLYYWDSYFISVGLLASGRSDLLQDVVDSIAELITVNGFAPNGNRSYYATRSQAPYFGLMLQLLGKAKGEAAAQGYRDVLRQEYEFWQADGHQMELADGRKCNRYWDFADTPRPEGYREDLETWYDARSRGVLEAEKTRIFRDLRSAAESGWDFSSRWLKQDEMGDWPLSSIRTTSILPVDLNCLIYGNYSAGLTRPTSSWDV